MVGFPDWLIPVNISRQELAEITNRPKYGGAQRAFFSDDIANGVTKQLVNLAGTGQTYGGSIRANSTTSFRDSILTVIVDGTTILSEFIRSYALFNLTARYQSFCVITAADDVDFVYSFAFPYGITFESTIIIHWKTASVADVSIASNFLYAIV